MFKLVVLSTLMAIAVAAPKPNGAVVYSAPTLVAASPYVVAPVVSPAVTSYSSYSNGVVHGSPVVVPVVRQAPVAHVVPYLQQTPVVHSLSYTYPEVVVA